MDVLFSGSIRVGHNWQVDHCSWPIRINLTMPQIHTMIPYQSKEDVKTQGTDVGHWRCHCGLATLGEPVPGPEVGEVLLRSVCLTHAGIVSKWLKGILLLKTHSNYPKRYSFMWPSSTGSNSTKQNQINGNNKTGSIQRPANLNVERSEIDAIDIRLHETAE